MKKRHLFLVVFVLCTIILTSSGEVQRKRAKKLKSKATSRKISRLTNRPQADTPAEDIYDYNEYGPPDYDENQNEYEENGEGKDWNKNLENIFVIKLVSA